MTPYEGIQIVSICDYDLISITRTPPDKGVFLMSLDVPTTMIAEAERGEISDEAFVAVIRESLPYAWQVISLAVADLGSDSTAEFGQHAVPPPDEQARGQLLRALASDSIRGALERHLGVRLAFQNCHRVAAFRLDAIGGETHREFCSARAQVLNQTPELRNC
jgi:hypothetical protein